jgi:branched-chain amino acid transport system substrate-binding protein
MRPSKVAAGVLLGASAMLAAACGSSTSSSTSSTTKTSTSSTSSAKAPKDITIGTLYATTGSFATSSEPEYEGLKFWIHEENASGGVYVKAFKKKIPLKLVSYNDQSSTSTAASLYTQLITQDHVDVFVSDFGSVLTAPAVTIAEEHKQLLFDVSGSGTTFFTPSDKYIVLTSLPVSSVWPKPAIEFLHAEGIKRVGIIYCSNDFDASQATTFKKGLSAAGVKVVYYQSVPTSTSSYTTLIQDVAAKRPQAVLELGYDSNDIAFLKQLHASGVHFNMVFTAFPGQLHHLLESNVGEAGMAYVYSYGFPPQLVHNDVNVGLGTTAFLKAFESYANTKNVNFLDVAGYNAGLAIQEALANASSFSQLAMRDALVHPSSPIKTIEGSFKLNSEGAQIGESLPVSQMMPSSNGSNTKVTLVYPSSLANGKAKYPAP